MPNVQCCHVGINCAMLDWHRYSGLCSNVRYLGHSKNLLLTLLIYLLMSMYSDAHRPSHAALDNHTCVSWSIF